MNLTVLNDKLNVKQQKKNQINWEPDLASLENIRRA